MFIMQNKQKNQFHCIVKIMTFASGLSKTTEAMDSPVNEWARLSQVITYGE